jgi:hypothetical protein
MVILIRDLLVHLPRFRCFRCRWSPPVKALLDSDTGLLEVPTSLSDQTIFRLASALLLDSCWGEALLPVRSIIRKRREWWWRARRVRVWRKGRRETTSWRRHHGTLQSHCGATRWVREVDREVARTEDYICSTTPQCRMCRVVRLRSEVRRRSL